MCAVISISTLTYLWLSNVLRMRNSVLGMVDATLRYAVKPAWSSVLLSLSEIFAWTSRSLYIQYLKNKLILLLKRKHLGWNPHFFNFYCPSVIHSKSHLANTFVHVLWVFYYVCSIHNNLDMMYNDITLK